jgi:biopolymer transport protein TolR
MGMGAASSGGKKRPMSDINVTPMVDVMLVLLVIFMVTAPVIKQIEGLEVKLPQLKGQPTQTIVTEDARTLVISPDGSVSREGAKSADDHYDKLEDLIVELKAYKEECEKGKKTPVVVIAGDRDAKWERIMQVWNAVRNADITQVSFQCEDTGKGAAAAPPGK